MSVMTKTTELCSGESDYEEFFDAVDSFPSGDLISDRSGSGSGSVFEDLGFVFLRNELKSLAERRQLFYQQMGFVDLSSCSGDCVVEVGSERIRESSEASSSCSSPSSSFPDAYTSCSSSSSSFPDAYTSGSDLTTSTDVDEREKVNGKANSTTDDESEISLSSAEETVSSSSSSSVHLGAVSLRKLNSNLKKPLHWWTKMWLNPYKKSTAAETTKVQVNKKRVKELSAVYTGQEFQAHKGAIWAAKMSPDRRYLASGGQDGVVRVWQISTADSCEKICFARRHGNSGCGARSRKGFRREKKVIQVPVMVPDKVFHVEESPVQEFHGHCGDILDLDWSTSNCLLSSSVDNTVRLWQIGSNECVKVFHHPDFVTCVQFNPVDDGHFVTGSVDGKIRVWGVSEGRVKDWDNNRDSVTTISYQPDGQGLAVGSLNGVCRFYKSSGGFVELVSQIQVGGNKRSSGNRVTGIQFLPEDNQKVMITSEDSKIRVVDKMNIIHKYRGFSGSGCQMSASFTHNQRHILSIGEDSRVYLWDHEITSAATSTTTRESPSFTPTKHTTTTSTKSVRSCESFHSKGVSVAVPWSSFSNSNLSSRSCAHGKSRCVSSSAIDSSSLPVPCLSNLLQSREGSVRVSATWPVELYSEDERSSAGCCGSRAWGLVIVTGSLDGTIRVFHNYGLPVRA